MGEEFNEKVFPFHTSSILHGVLLGTWFTLAEYVLPQ
jgi:hypothetical protein